MAEETRIGKVTHFFSKINVAVIELSDTLKVGDTIGFRGATTDFNQKVDSMQVEHKNIQEAAKGQAIGMKVAERVREEDLVYRIE